jgi:hypothetical protein
MQTAPFHTRYTKPLTMQKTSSLPTTLSSAAQMQNDGKSRRRLVHQTHSWALHVLGSTRRCMGAAPIVTKPCPTTPKHFDEDAGQYWPALWPETLMHLAHCVLRCRTYHRPFCETNAHPQAQEQGCQTACPSVQKDDKPKPTGGGQNSQPVLEKPFDSRMYLAESGPINP